MPHPKSNDDDDQDKIESSTPNPLFDDKIIQEKAEKTMPKYDVREPSFVDIIPYFQPLGLLVFTHIMYIMTGSMILPGWIIYIGTPFYNMFFLSDDKNLDKKMDKVYLKS